MAGNVPEYKLSALRRALLGDESSSTGNKDREQDLIEFCLQVAAGEDVDQIFYDDLRKLNSRGGKGIGATCFDDFFKTAKGILHSTTEPGDRGTSTWFKSGYIVRVQSCFNSGSHA